MPLDLTDFEPAPLPKKAAPLDDFEPVSTPSTVKAPQSTSDLSDFEPAPLTDYDKAMQATREAQAALMGPTSIAGGTLYAADAATNARNEKEAADYKAAVEATKAAQEATMGPTSIIGGTLKAADQYAADPSSMKATPTVTPWQPFQSDVVRAPVPSKPITPEDEAVVRKASAEGKPVVMVNGRPTVGEKPETPPLSTGERVTQGIESALGTTAMKIGAGLSRIGATATTDTEGKTDTGLADTLSQEAAQWEQQQPTDTASKIGRGIGGAATLIASGGLPGAMTSIGLQSQAEKLSFGAALKQVPELAAYWLLGMGASKMIGPLVEQSGPFVKTLAHGAASTGANILSSAAIRKANGQPLLPDAESLAQDALFGFGMHGMEAGREAVKDRAQVVTMLRHAPDDALRAAAADPNFRKSAPYDPGLIDSEIMRRDAVTKKNEALSATVRAAQETRALVQPILQTLPGDTQQQVVDILAKQERGEPLTANERATLAQVKSHAAKIASGQTNAEFTGQTSRQSPSPETASPEGRAAVPPSPSVQGGTAESFRKAKAEAVAPLEQTAESNKDVVPNAAAAAEQAAQAIKAQEPAAETTKPEIPEQTAKQISTDAKKWRQETRSKGEIPESVQLPKGTVVTSKAYAGEGGIIIDGPAYKGPNGYINYPVKYTGTGRVGGFEAENITTIKSKPELTPSPAVEPAERTGGSAKPQAAGEPVPGTRIVGPVIVDKTGKPMAEGEIGQGHADLKSELIDKGNAEAADYEHKFKDDKGNILNREQAWQLAKQAGQIPADVLAAQERGETPPELRSEHLTQKAKETAPEPVAAEPPVAAPTEPVQQLPVEKPKETPTLAPHEQAFRDRMLQELDEQPVNVVKQRKFTVKRAVSDPHFAADPFVQEVENQGGLLSKSAAKDKWSTEKWNKDKGTWDDAPDKWGDPSHNKIYNPNGLTPDEMTTALIERGLLKEGDTASDMWRELKQRSESAARMKKQEGALNREIKEKETQQKSFTKEAAKPSSGQPINIGELKVGDKVKIGDQELTVQHVDEDGNVVLEDGKKFGIQQVTEDETIYGELTPTAEAEPLFLDPKELEAALDADKLKTDADAESHIKDHGLVAGEETAPVAPVESAPTREADTQGQGGAGKTGGEVADSRSRTQQLESARKFKPKTPDAKSDIKYETYEFTTPSGSNVIGRWNGVYVRNEIDPNAGEIFIIGSKKTGEGLPLFLDAINFLKSTGKDKVVMTHVGTEDGKAMVAAMQKIGVLGEEIDRFDSATHVFSLKEKGEVAKPSLPKLAPGKQSSELLQGENEVFNLVSETAADKAKRIAREDAEAAKKAAADAAEAKAKQDREQLDIFAEKPKGKAAKSAGNEKADSIAAEINDRLKRGMPRESPEMMRLKSELGGIIDPDIRLSDKYQLADVYAMARNGEISAEEFTKFHNNLRSQFESLRGKEPAFKIGEAKTPTETLKTEAPKAAEPPAKLDPKKVRAEATKLPESIGQVIINVLNKGRTVEDAAAEAGVNPAKAQEAVNKVREYLTKAKTVEPLQPGTYEQESTKEIPAPSDKQSWQKTRDEVKAEGGGLVKHAFDIQSALKAGEKVPLEVLEDYKGRVWADKAREKLYGQEVSDTLLGRILKSLEDDRGTLNIDPFLLKTVGKPILKAAVEIAIKAREGGKLAGDAVRDAIAYIKTQVKNLDEAKAWEFFKPFLEPPKPEKIEEQPLPGMEPPKPEPTKAVDPNDVIGIRDAIMEEKRAQWGLEPRTPVVKKEHGVALDNAKSVLATDAGAGKRLVDELGRKTRPLTDDEDALLSLELVHRQNEYDAATHALHEATTPDDQAAARVRLAFARDNLFEIIPVSEDAGTANARGLNARKILLRNDFSLVKLAEDYREAVNNNGRNEPLNEEQKKMVEKLHADLDAARKGWAAAEAARDEERVKRLAAEKIAEKIKEKSGTTKKTEPETSASKKPLSKSVVDFVDARMEEARQRMRERRQKLFADPLGFNLALDAADAVIIGAGHIAKKVVSFGKWSAKMLEEFGPEIKPHLRDLHEKAKKEAKTMLSQLPRDYEAERKSTVEGMQKRIGEGDSIHALGNYVDKLLDQFIGQGMTSRELLIDAVHNVLREVDPNITRRQTMEAITRYGDWKELDKDPVKVIRRDIKGQSRELLKIQDMEEGRAPLATGREYPTPSDEERRLAKITNEMKKKGGYVVTDPARQLKTALDAKTTRLKNEIADLDFQIATGQRIIREKTASPENEETKALTATRDAKKAELDALVGKRGASDLEKIASLEKSAQKSLEEWQKKLDDARKGIFDGKKEPKSQLTSDKLEAIKTARGEAKAEIDWLKSLKDPKLTDEQRATKAFIARRLGQYYDLLKRQSEGDIGPRPKKAAFDFTKDPEAKEAEKLFRNEQQRVRNTLEEVRQKSRSLPERIGDFIVKWNREAKLSSLTVIPKLVEAGLIRVVMDPVGRVIGQPLRLIPGFAEKAPMELGLSGKAEARALAALWSPKEVWNKLRTHKSTQDVLYQKEGAMREMRGFVGNIHGVIKEPVRQSIMARTETLLADRAGKEGVDLTEPAAETAIKSAALEHANRGIFLGENLVSKYLSDIPLQALRNAKKHPATARAFANALEFLMPVIKVTTNIGIHTTRLNPLVGFGETAIRLTNALRKGELADRAATLPKEDAEVIARAFKAGAIGTLLAVYAWQNPQQFGGVDTEEDKKKNRTLKTGEVRVGNVVIPRWMNHAPELNFLNTVASARRIFDQNYHRGDKWNAGLEALAFATMSPVKNLPFIDTWVRLFGGHETSGQKAGVMLRDVVIPGAVTSTLRLTDPKERAPKTFLDEVKMGIPWKRQEVPVKKRRLSYSK